MPATAFMAAGLLLAPACGGNLEGRYRRGELTTTTTGGTRSTVTTPATVASTTTTTTAPTRGNAAGQGARGEPEAPEGNGTIVGSAAWRTVVSPLGGRHR